MCLLSFALLCVPLLCVSRAGACPTQRCGCSCGKAANDNPLVGNETDRWKRINAISMKICDKTPGLVPKLC